MQLVKRLVLWTLVLSPLLLTLIMLPTFSDEVPMQFDFNNEVARYGSRYEMLTAPGLNIAVVLLFLGIGHLIVKKGVENGATGALFLYLFSLAITIMLGILHLSHIYAGNVITQNPAQEIDTMRAIYVILGGIYVLLGILLPVCKRNYLFGFRTKQTLSCEATWVKTHRHGGIAMMIYGILALLFSLFISNWIIGIIISATGASVMVYLILLYSYNVYKKAQLIKTHDAT